MIHNLETRLGRIPIYAGYRAQAYKLQIVFEKSAHADDFFRGDGCRVSSPRSKAAESTALQSNDSKAAAVEFSFKLHHSLYTQIGTGEVVYSSVITRWKS